MEEKKLTDEEILNIYEYCLIGREGFTCTGCPFKKNGCSNLGLKVFEITRRLQSENERLTEEKQSLIGRKAGLDYSYNQVKEKNAELQKQADELKEQKAFWEGMHDRVCSELEELKEEKSNTDLVTQIYVLKNKLEQAVKDTAKEIYKEIGKGDILVVQTQEYGEIEVVPIERLKEIIKQKGVEVE